MSLDHIHIVLVSPTHPGNIGGVARAMKNMGLTRLTLVAPVRPIDVESHARAAGADDVLAAARVVPTLEAAIGGCRLVIGTSGRHRTLGWPTATPREAASQVLAAAAYGEVALLFGREATGLTNDELERCGLVLSIPCNPDFASLNLAAAVQVLGYELWMAAGGLAPVAPAIPLAGDQPAPAADVERFFEHIEATMTRIGFLDPNNPRKLMRRLRRLFGRSALTDNEVSILRGLLSAVDQKTNS